MKKKIISIVYFLLLITSFSNAQAIYIRQVGKVVYQGNTLDKDSLFKKTYADLCNNYINQYYVNRKLPLIYLILSFRSDSMSCELSFDNLNGNSLDNQLYNHKSKYSMPGIRIYLISNKMEQKTLLALLDYAINNLSALKSIRKNALKRDYYDRPNSLSLKKDIIKHILATQIIKH